jgi:hypothetical protein
MLKLKAPPSAPNQDSTASEPLCDKCAEALQRRHESYTFSPWYDYGRFDDLSSSVQSSSLLSSQPSGKPKWVWSLSELVSSAQTCSSCSYLQEVLRTDERLAVVHLKEEDRLVFCGQDVGRCMSRGICIRGLIG